MVISGLHSVLTPRLATRQSAPAIQSITSFSEEKALVEAFAGNCETLRGSLTGLDCNYCKYWSAYQPDTSIYPPPPSSSPTVPTRKMSHRKTEMSLIVALGQSLPAALNWRHKGAKQIFSRIKASLQFYNRRPPYSNLTTYPGAAWSPPESRAASGTSRRFSTQRRCLLVPSPCWKRLLALSNLNWDACP